ncbi:hypothetical protein OCAE111667_09160 [Occultella aeris]|uniref:Uncharacterized protein n=1 Tax=Occultella aeris TaxID=2761496 RepID=A0A7M4DJU9_9MICO|nr:hypothetical protein [Occultella aeris]VZO37334.1 hypothetical protein HALOF300_02407 [Occultella aeris]
MSELIPNLNDLRAHLPVDDTAADAREFLGEVAKGQSFTEVTANVGALVDRWLEVPHGNN